jgi:hypothetical protein
MHIIIDEMSMMTNTMLFAIEQCLKQAQSNANPFTNVWVLLADDLAQLPITCKHCPRILL